MTLMWSYNTEHMRSHSTDQMLSSLCSLFARPASSCLLSCIRELTIRIVKPVA